MKLPWPPGLRQRLAGLARPGPRPGGGPWLSRLRRRSEALERWGKTWGKIKGIPGKVMIYALETSDFEGFMGGS